MASIDNKFLKGQLVEAFMVILLVEEFMVILLMEVICYGGLCELVVILSTLVT